MEMTSYTTVIIGVILFLLASLGVINSMFMSIYERIYEFGVIKAIGTKPSQIFQLVLCEAALLGILSCFFGAMAGYGLGSYFAENGIPIGRIEISGVILDGNVHTRISPSQFINYPIYVILLTIAAAVYPARFAAKIVPSIALQRTL